MKKQETAKPLENSPLLKLQEKYGDPSKNACLLPERALQTFKTCLKNTEANAFHRDQIEGFRQQWSDAQTVMREDLFGIAAVDEAEKRAYLRQFQSYTETIMAWMNNAFQNHKANKVEHERLKLRRDALFDQLSMMLKADNDVLKDLAASIKLLQVSKKDISAGQIRNYPNVLNAMIRLGEVIRSLEKMPDKQDDKTIRRLFNKVKNSRKELQDIVSDSISEPASYIKVTSHLNDLIGDLNELPELLATKSRDGDGEQASEEAALDITKGEWSPRMSKQRMMDALDFDHVETFNTFAKRHGLYSHSRSLHQIRVDKMDSVTRKKLQNA